MRETVETSWKKILLFRLIAYPHLLHSLSDLVSVYMICSEILTHLIKVYIVNNMKTILSRFHNLISPRRGGVEVERSPRIREIGVRSPVATELSRKNR